MLMGLITTDLGERGGLPVVSVAKVMSALRQVSPGDHATLETAWVTDAAQLAGADLMITGQVGTVGERLVLTAELVEVATGRVLGTQRHEVDSREEVISLAAELSRGFRQELGFTDGVAFELTESITDSARAYRYFVSGEFALQNGRYIDAAGEYEQALREDPEFALAHYKLALARWWQGDYEATLVELERGAPYVGRLPEHWQIIRSGLENVVSENYDEAHWALTRLLTTAKVEVPDGLYLLGEIATHSLRHRDGQAAREFFENAMELDPTFRLGGLHLINLYLAAGDVPGVHHLLDRYLEAFPTDGTLLSAKVLVLAAQGQFEDAYALAASLPISQNDWAEVLARLQDEDWEPVAGLVQSFSDNLRGNPTSAGLAAWGLAEVGLGRFEGALAFTKKAIGHAESSDFVTRHGLQYARLLKLTGDLDGALLAIEAAIEANEDGTRAYYEKGCVFISMGELHAAEQALQELRAVASDVPSPVGEYWSRLLEAELRLAEEDPAATLTILDELRSLPPENLDSVVFLSLTARAHVAKGEREAALNAYREMRDPSTWFPVWELPDVPTKILALYHQAVLEEELGEFDDAREHYENFLSQWRMSDLPVPGVEDALERLAALDEAQG